MANQARRSRMVLVVDPDVEFAEDLRAVLADDRVVTARSVADAADIAAGGRVDAAVLGPSFGYETAVRDAGAILEADPTIRIVLATNIVTNRVLLAAVQTGLVDVVDTPVTPRKLSTALMREPRQPAPEPVVRQPISAADDFDDPRFAEEPAMAPESRTEAWAEFEVSPEPAKAAEVEPVVAAEAAVAPEQPDPIPVQAEPQAAAVAPSPPDPEPAPWEVLGDRLTTLLDRQDEILRLAAEDRELRAAAEQRAVAELQAAAELRMAAEVAAAEPQEQPEPAPVPPQNSVAEAVGEEPTAVLDEAPTEVAVEPAADSEPELTPLEELLEDETGASRPSGPSIDWEPPAELLAADPEPTAVEQVAEIELETAAPTEVEASEEQGPSDDDALVLFDPGFAVAPPGSEPGREPETSLLEEPMSAAEEGSLTDWAIEVPAPELPVEPIVEQDLTAERASQVDEPAALEWLAEVPAPAPAQRVEVAGEPGRPESDDFLAASSPVAMGGIGSMVGDSEPAEVSAAEATDTTDAGPFEESPQVSPLRVDREADDGDWAFSGPGGVSIPLPGADPFSGEAASDPDPFDAPDAPAAPSPDPIAEPEDPFAALSSLDDSNPFAPPAPNDLPPLAGSNVPPKPAAPPPRPDGPPPMPPDLPAVEDGPADLEALGILGRDDEPTPVARGSGKVIAVMSGKGGSGKTITATNLATALTMDLGSGRVAIVDADLQFGDVALLLQLDPSRTIADAASHVDELTPSALERLMLTHESGLDVLAAPVTPVTAAEVSAKSVVRMAEMLTTSKDVVIIDTPPVFDDGLVDVLGHSDRVLLVVDMDLPSVKNAKIALDTLRLSGFPIDRIRLIVNRVDSKARLDLVELERSLGHEVFGTIPSDRIIPQSVNEGIPAVALGRRTRVARAFRRMAEALTADLRLRK